jgi:hypothetical protein
MADRNVITDGCPTHRRARLEDPAKKCICKDVEDQIADAARFNALLAHGKKRGHEGVMEQDKAGNVRVFPTLVEFCDYLIEKKKGVPFVRVPLGDGGGSVN